MLVQIEDFVNWMRRRNPTARTWRDYCYDLQQFVAIVGDRPPNTVTFHDVDRFVIAQTERGLRPSTINRRLARLSTGGWTERWLLRPGIVVMFPIRLYCIAFS